MCKCLVPFPYNYLLTNPIWSVGSVLICRLMLNIRDPEVLKEPNSGFLMTSTLVWSARTNEMLPWWWCYIVSLCVSWNYKIWNILTCLFWKVNLSIDHRWTNGYWVFAETRSSSGREIFTTEDIVKETEWAVSLRRINLLSIYIKRLMLGVGIKTVLSNHKWTSIPGEDFTRDVEVSAWCASNGLVCP